MSTLSCKQVFSGNVAMSTAFMCEPSDSDWLALNLYINAHSPPFDAGPPKFVFISGPNPNLWSNGTANLTQTIANLCTLSIAIAPFGNNHIIYQMTSANPAGVYNFISAPGGGPALPATLTFAACSNWPSTLHVDSTFLAATVPFMSPGGPFFTGVLTYNGNPNNPGWGENLSDGSSIAVGYENLNPGVDDPSFYIVVTGNHAPNFFTYNARDPSVTTTPLGNYSYAVGAGLPGYPPGIIHIT